MSRYYIVKSYWVQGGQIHESECQHWGAVNEETKQSIESGCIVGDMSNLRIDIDKLRTQNAALSEELESYKAEQRGYNESYRQVLEEAEQTRAALQEAMRTLKYLTHRSELRTPATVQNFVIGKIDRMERDTKFRSIIEKLTEGEK